MDLNQNFEFVSMSDSIAANELKNGVNLELENFFDSVMATVVDYFEEAKVV